MNNKNSKNEDQGKRTGYYEPVKPSFLLFFIIITVFITIIITNFIQNRQLKDVKYEIEQLDKKQDKIELGRIEELSVRQLAEKIDYVMSQQEVTVSSSQGMLDYMTFSFSIIGIFFLLASGYFLYRQQKSEKREDEGWVLAKDLLELVTESQSFVVQVQKELQKQQESQKEQQKQIKEQIQQTVNFLDSRSTVLISQFARDTINKSSYFNKLVDISTRIDTVKFQLSTYNFVLHPNCYFLKTVYEYIIGNYNTAKNEFDNLIKEKENTILDDIPKKQLSLCYYYRGLIEYNVQGNLDLAEKFLNLALENDPLIHNPDYKSRIIRAEIKFKKGDPKAFDEFYEIRTRLMKTPIRTQTQDRLLCHANLGMVYCKILQGDRKFLPKYYSAIKGIEKSTILQAIKWLKESTNEQIYTFLTMGQIGIIFEESYQGLGLEKPNSYFEETYHIIEKTKPYEAKEETRGKILGYSVKLVCEKYLENSLIDYTLLMIKNFLNDRELKSIYSIFSKMNVAKSEFIEELEEFVERPC